MFLHLCARCDIIAGIVFYVGFARNSRGFQVADGGICSLPAETGPCRGLFPKWYYDSGTKSCKEFTYGGCDGNKNKFDDQAACMAACGQ